MARAHRGWNSRPVQTRAVLLILALHLGGSAATAQPAFPNAWVTNGLVYSVEASGSTIYAGGVFSMVGPPTGAAVAMDEATGTLLQPWPRVGGRVDAVEPDGSGGWYVGGLFACAGGVARSNVAHFDANGNVTSWNPGTNHLVSAIKRSGNTVYIGGLFTTVGGLTRNRVAAIDATTGAVLSWDPNATGFTPIPPGTAQVKAIEVSGGMVYLGGTFAAIQGAARGGFAEVDASTGSPTSWTIGVDQVHALVISGGRLYVGSGVSGSGKIRVFETATHDSLGNPTAFSAPVNAIAVDSVSAVIYAGGTFGTVGGVARSRLAALNGPTGGVTAWNPNPNGNVSAVRVTASGIVVGGQFTTLGGLPRPYLAKVDPTTGSPSTWSPRPGESVRALAVANGTLYVGGVFSLMNGVDRNCLAAFDATTGVATPWAPSANNTVLTLFPSGNTLYVGGFFSTISGQPRNGGAAFDLTDGTLKSWDPNVTRFDVAGDVRSIVVVGNTAYLGGNFSKVGNVLRQNFAAVDATTGGLASWYISAGAGVYALRATYGPGIPTTIYLAGSFTNIGAVSRGRLAAVDASGPTPTVTPWNPSANEAVWDLAVLKDASGAAVKFYAGGSFTTMGGAPHSFVAEIDAGGVASAWDPGISGGAVGAVDDALGAVYVGGNFTTVGGQPRACLAAFDIATGTLMPWVPTVEFGMSASTTVISIATKGNYVYAGGAFSSVGNSAVSNIATIASAVTAVEENPVAETPSILRAAPNPFGDATTIRFSVRRGGTSLVSVYDVSGRLVRRLYDGMLTKGSHTITWNGLDQYDRVASSGIYFIQVKSGNVTSSSKVFRLR